MSVAAISQTAAASPTIAYYQSPSIPTRFRPSQSYIQTFGRITNNAVHTTGFWIYDISGVLQIYTSPTQAGFTLGAGCGYSEFRSQIVFLINTLTFFYSWTWSTY